MKPIKNAEWLQFGSFEDDHEVCHAAAECRESGFEIVDVYGPFPVHGMDKALGLRSSRLTWVCFAFGLTGLLAALWFQHWTSATNWPLNIGGKPFNSLPAFIPVAFETTVLFAGLGTVATFLIWAKLFPGRRSYLGDRRVTDDRFVIVVRGCGRGSARNDLQSIFEKHGACESWETLREAKA